MREAEGKGWLERVRREGDPGILRVGLRGPVPWGIQRRQSEATTRVLRANYAVWFPGIVLGVCTDRHLLQGQETLKLWGRGNKRMSRLSETGSLPLSPEVPSLAHAAWKPCALSILKGPRQTWLSRLVLGRSPEIALAQAHQHLEQSECSYKSVCPANYIPFLLQRGAWVILGGTRTGSLSVSAWGGWIQMLGKKTAHSSRWGVSRE